MQDFDADAQSCGGFSKFGGRSLPSASVRVCFSIPSFAAAAAKSGGPPGPPIQIRIRDDGAAIALRAKDRKAVQQHAHHDGVAALAVNRFAQAGRRGVIVIGAAVLQEMRIAIVQKRRSVLGILVVHRDDRALGGFRNR